MFTSEENINANEFDFKRALDLLNYVDKVTLCSVMYKKST